MDKHLGVFITLMNSHLHVSLNYTLRVITHHVPHPIHGPLGGVGVMLLGCATYNQVKRIYLMMISRFSQFF